jgi:heme/copper-type cytochrome/quinol oxidase subunit 3
VSAPAGLIDRADRHARAADVAMWLFVASIVMFVGSLVSGYVLLRAGGEHWPMPWRHDGVAVFADPWFRLLWLVVAAVTARTAARDAGSRGPSWLARHPLPIAALAGVVFIARTGSAGQALLAAGHGPASHNAPAAWFALNGVIAVLALGGVVATMMAALGTTEPMPRRRHARLLTRYWITLAASFAVIAIGMYIL